jgi:hypothetical protein
MKSALLYSYFIFIILLGHSVSAQSDSIVKHEVKPKSEIIIVKQNKAALFFDDQHSLKIISITDERCPFEEECFWGGTATIEFEFITKTNTQQLFSLDYHLDYKNDTLIDSIQIALSNLTPDRINNRSIAIEDYIVTVEVTKRDTAAETKKYLDNLLNQIPRFFYDSTGIAKTDITVFKENFEPGCVQDGTRKPLLLNSVKILGGRIKIISISSGGKRLITKQYFLDVKRSRILQVKKD